MVWSQIYNPLGNAWLSTLVAAIPIVVLLGALGIFRIKAHVAAIYGLIASLLVATIVYGMPVSMAGETAVFGAAFGLMPIGWIILNVIFLYQLTLEKGYFKVMQDSIAGVSQDRRLQLLLIAFCFGAFFEGASGFGTPVAVTGAILIGLGFSPLAASGLSLIANTAPVAYGALGTPIIALAAVTGLDRGGRHLCHPAISDLELSRPLACRRSLVRGVNGLPYYLPPLLATQKDMDIDHAGDWNASRSGNRT